MSVASASTPLMQQYRGIKARHQNAILFFRMGEFYEMFYDDAEVAARVLGLTLTARNNGGAAEVPLAGIPVKAAADYIRRLVQQGFRVAVCEQVEDPRAAKGIVKREVIETITPGVAFADDLLDGTRNNFLCALALGSSATPDALIGVAAADISTGEFRIAIVRRDGIDPLLARLSPRELVVPIATDGSPTVARAGAENALTTEREAWEFDPALAGEELQRQFRLQSLDALGLVETDAPGLAAAGALLRYLRELQPGGLPHLARPVVERADGGMPLDEMTRRNLELVESLRGGGTEGTLLSVLDRTRTAMGARLMRQWLLAPLADRTAIEQRLDAVEALNTAGNTRELLRDALDGVRDVERLAAKAAAARSTPRELRALGDSLARLPLVHSALASIGARGVLAGMLAQWDNAGDVAADLQRTFVERPPLAVGDEPTIAPGLDAELDELRALRDGGKDGVARIQAEERERTGIASLKVGFNNVFGYYIEVTRANIHLVPPEYQRRQTIANGERFVTPTLKEYEERILTASERIEARERALFEAARERAGAEIARMQQIARCVAALDVLAALADVAAREGYTRPALTDDYTLDIRGGRHPVVERMMPRDKFIPNDVLLTDDARMIILTGPNMAGKSTVLRQTGLIVLLAQVGSFVPARSAEVGVVDRLFTRVGASDNLVRGQSTFMVEMAETSAILHTATSRSLVLLDEIGRGTSTYDGVSIAWAVSEHVHDRIGCKTIFATHYHELTQLTERLAAVRNFNVSVREVGEEILFLHRLQPGGADRSYGIEVGRLAGLPRAVIDRARSILRDLEGSHDQPHDTRARPRTATPTEAAPQLALFAATAHPALERLRSLEPNAMTPIEALTTLAALVEQARVDAAP